MADDGESTTPTNKPKSHRPQETFHRAQETQVERKFPHYPTGINRGPKSLCLKRNGDSFGFTLRHFIVYPPDSIAETHDGRYAAVGALSAPMDTIFVKSVKDPSPAKRAGLRQGDRLVKVNDILVTNKHYSEVVQLIQNTPDWLYLLVVPKEDDILQRYFAETAYNPASNQQQRQLTDRQAAQHFLTQTFTQPREFQVDAISWRSLQNSYGYDYRQPLYEQRSADNLDLNERDNDAVRRSHRARAQPQVPRKMGRRASDGCALADDYYDYPQLEYEEMKAVQNQEMPALRYPNSAGCRRSLDAGRRESSSSLTSSLADGSKDSLSSYDSTSTLTGHDTDDSAIISRLRRSFQQKEEFLKMSPETLVRQREFYSRPKKLEKSMWPPQESPTKTKPTHQNFQRVKNDIEVERDLLQGLPQQKGANSPNDKMTPMTNQIKEASTAPINLDKVEQFNGASENDEKRPYPPSLQMVHKRARQFESGRPLPEDDPLLSDRTSFYRSELARLSNKKVVPNVTERAQEFETRSGSPKREVSMSPKKIQRDSRSLESSDASENRARIHARSNSTESWVLVDEVKPVAAKRISRQDAVSDDGNKTKVMTEEKEVVKRRTKNTNIADDERTTRRESYLKATETGRMHFDSDMSDGDASPQALRSGSSSSNASLDREKANASPLEKEKHPVIREGPLHCKITEIDGKRSGDRSWKQIWAALKGPKLFLHKDKHHQSPMGTSDAVEHSLASGVDMRASDVKIAEDYTKRKHVLRVSSVNPCRSEFLLQAENTDEFTDWFKALQEQMATSTEAENDPQTGSKQQAVPQTIPASTSILVQGGSSRLSPQPIKSKPSTTRNRSPTGQSPVSKTRKPSQTPDPSTSPKVKTWRGRVAKQFRKMHGASSPSSPTAPEGSTFGIPLDQCLTSSNNPYVPKFVEVCTDIVDQRGLQTVGIYRVPGNNASITALTEEINRNYDEVPVEDPRWNDLHVVSSLLKAYFRKIPDSLVTSALYPNFIKADKIENPQLRLKELKRLVKSLPPHNYHTLRHIVLHLRRVVENSDVNKMEAKNLAIVFGPNIVRPDDDNMETMVNNMTHQCKIVETLLTAADWFFNEDESDEALPVAAAISDAHEEAESCNQMLLLDNISKYEALKDKEKNGALFSSIISAAQRKVKRKSTKGSGSLNESKEEVTSPNGNFGYTSTSLDLKDSTTTENSKSVIPTTVTDIEKVNKPPEKVPWFNYSTDKEDFHRRIENFRQETQAMLQMPRNLEISVNNIAAKSTSAGRLSTTKAPDPHLLKTNSASNVFTRTINVDNRHSLDNSYSVQYTSSGSEFGSLRADTNRNEGRFVMRRGNSAENVNTTDMNANGAMKKIKYENEGDLGQRMGSLDSLNKVTTDDDTDLTSVITLLDKKLNKTSRENLLSGEGFPYADESPEKTHKIITHSLSDKENLPNLNDLYRNPSLHKNQYSNKSNYLHKEQKNDPEKDEDSTEKNISHKILKRSESLNKPERTHSPHNSKLKRSESLNKTGDNKLKRSDSLTKTEKTESNLNKRRELAMSVRRGKDVTKLKRKNGMPDRSIKRRHTVGGTKDPDKVTWLDNKYQEEVTSNKENKEKNLRTSSPDLSSTRRERLCFEINLIGPENMVMALKQHLIGARPQSFPDTAVFKVPLESHV